MTGELFINNKDAFTTWGIGLEDGALSALMTPSPMKDYIENSSRLEHGTRVITSNAKMDERSITLQIHLTAKDENTFLTNYASFCEELKGAVLNIRTKYQPTVMYKTIYVSCSQFSQFMRGLAKFSLRLREPNPADRSIS